MSKRYTKQPFALIGSLLMSTILLSTSLSWAETQTNIAPDVGQQRSTEPANTLTLTSVMDSYYSNLNQQLDKQLNRRDAESSNPFSKLPEAQTPNVQFRPINLKADKSNHDLFSSPNTKTTLPPMNFRGLMQSKGKKMALLEISGLGTFVVKQGDKVGLQQVGPAGAVLHILEINELNLIVETGSYGQQMVVQ